MQYARHIQERVEKYEAFFADTSPGQILVAVTPYTFPLDYSRWGLEDRPLNSWDFERQADEFVEYEVRKLRCFLDYTKDLDNDFIPAISPGLGIGMNSAYFSGQDILFGEDTSWIHPVIEQWEDMEKLRPDEQNRWYRLIRRMTEKIVKLSEGDYAPAAFPHFAPMDMANALRGNELFYDFYDSPEKVHQLLDISADAIIWLQHRLHDITGDMMGGTAVGGMWIPGEAPFMSEDATDLCSAGLYREFGFHASQKVIDTFGGAYIHHHAKGWHVHRDIARLRGLKTLEISWDPNCPRPIDHLGDIYEKSNGLPIMTRCTAADVYERIDEMKQGRMVLMLNIRDLNEGREVIRWIRKHSIL